MVNKKTTHGSDTRRKPEKLLVARRGESHDAPGNTPAAAMLAWLRKNKAVEEDMHCITTDRLDK